LKVAGWCAIALSVAILVVFTGIRLAEMSRNPPGTDAFGVRYLRHPGIALVHMLPGLFFLAGGSLQFVTRIRRRNIRIHRRLGWVLATLAATSGLFALIVSFTLPAFGGLTTQTATVFFGAIFLFALIKAIRHIRRKEIQRHREWMIRVYALAMGVATIRLFVGSFVGLGRRFEDAFGPSFWLGFAVNLLVAEIWINHTRAPITSMTGRFVDAERPAVPAGRVVRAAGPRG
jgi:uncharacterized membrane protein